MLKPTNRSLCCTTKSLSIIRGHPCVVLLSSFNCLYMNILYTIYKMSLSMLALYQPITVTQMLFLSFLLFTFVGKICNYCENCISPYKLTTQKNKICAKQQQKTTMGLKMSDTMVYWIYIFFLN